MFSCEFSKISKNTLSYRTTPVAASVRCFLKFQKFHRSLYLIKLQFWGPATLLKRHRHWCFPVEFAKFLRTTILKNFCERLLLNLFKKRLQPRCFPVNIANYSRTFILKSTYERLVLKTGRGFSLIKLQAWRPWGL